MLWLGVWCMVGTRFSSADKARLPATDKSWGMHQPCVCVCDTVLLQYVPDMSPGQCVMHQDWLSMTLPHMQVLSHVLAWSPLRRDTTTHIDTHTQKHTGCFIFWRCTFWNSNFVKIKPDLIKLLSVSLNISDSWCPLCSCLQMRWPNSSFMWTNWATKRSPITSILKTCGAVLSGEDLICPSHRELQGNRPPKILEPRKRWGLKTCEMVWKKFGTTDIFSFMHWNPVNPPSVGIWLLTEMLAQLDICL